MMLAAWNDGVGSCIASVYRVDDARQILGFPAEYFLHHIISFGYPAHPPRPPARADATRSPKSSRTKNGIIVQLQASPLALNNSSYSHRQ